MNLRFEPKQDRNHSGFVLIGAGLSRTGTLSTRAALYHLLDGACYHATDLVQGEPDDIGHWNKAYKTGCTSQEWVDFFEGKGYRAGVDFPLALFYK